MPKFSHCNPLILLLAATFSAGAQQTIGSVSTADAAVGGVLQTSGDTATILTNGTITAHDHTAAIKLTRGGTVQVCQSSVVHLTAATGGPLLIGLDRGALEISLHATSGDAILTPDMRMQPAASGALDLRLRVVSNGDTCVENRGSAAPALMISDSFGETSYIVHAQQHVLFEHGSLRQVVDNERSPCGCPPPVQSVAESGVSGGQTARPGDAVAPAAVAHPFPEAVSEGLAPASPPPQQSIGETHSQLNLTLAYDAGTPAGIGSAGRGGSISGSSAASGALRSAAGSVAQMTAASGAMASSPDAQPVIAQAPAPPPPPPDDVVHIVARLYRWIFHHRS